MSITPWRVWLLLVLGLGLYFAQGVASADCDDPLIGYVDSVEVIDDGGMQQAIIHGWVAHLLPNDPTALQVFIDGVAVRSGWLDPVTVQLGLERRDVAQQFARPEFTNLGFRITLPLVDLSAGVHNIQIAAVDVDGARHGLPTAVTAQHINIHHPACCSTDTAVALGLMPMLGLICVGGLGILFVVSEANKSAGRPATAHNLGLRDLPIALSLIFPISIAVFIVLYAVNVPFFDEWEFGKLWLAFQQGGWQKVVWADLWAQHNEHRLVVSRLIFLGLTQLLGEWNPMHFMALSLALACVFWGLLCRIIWLGLPHAPRWRWLAIMLSSAFIFSWAQLENWLWGFQYPWYLANLLALLTLYLLNTRVASLKIVLLAIVLTVVTTFTNGSGLPLWVCGGALLIYRQRGLSRLSLGRVGLWFLAMALTLGAYAIDYAAPPGIPAPAWAFAHLDYTFAFLMTLLGATWWSGVGEYASQAAAWLGLALLALLLVTRLVAQKSTHQPINQIDPPAFWASLMGFGLLNAISTSIGRSGFGLEYALTGRYQTTVICFWLGLLLLLIGQVANCTRTSTKHRLLLVVIAASCVPLLLGFADAQAQAYRVAVRRAYLFQSHIAALYQYATICDAALSPFYSQVSVVRQVAAGLDHTSQGPFSPSSRAVNERFLHHLR